MGTILFWDYDNDVKARLAIPITMLSVYINRDAKKSAEECKYGPVSRPVTTNDIKMAFQDWAEKGYPEEDHHYELPNMTIGKGKAYLHIWHRGDERVGRMYLVREWGKIGTRPLTSFSFTEELTL